MDARMQDSKFSKEIKLSRTDGADSPGKRIAVLGGRGMLGQDLLTCLRRERFPTALPRPR